MSKTRILTKKKKTQKIPHTRSNDIKREADNVYLLGLDVLQKRVGNRAVYQMFAQFYAGNTKGKNIQKKKEKKLDEMGGEVLFKARKSGNYQIEASQKSRSSKRKIHPQGEKDIKRSISTAC